MDFTRKTETLTPTGWDGEWTVTEVSIPQMLDILDDHRGDSHALSFALIAVSATGPDGQKLTMADVENLPARYVAGFSDLANAALRVNGLSAEKN